MELLGGQQREPLGEVEAQVVAHVRHLRLAQALADRGVTAFVLKYRLAREEGSTYTVDQHAVPDAQRAIRYMIEHLARDQGLSREQAYCLCGAAVDLKISEVVDEPNWIVSAFLPESIFI